MKILIADDDRMTRLLLARVLESWGYHVTAVASGDEAWQRLQEGDFSLLLTDWEMSGFDGPTLCRLVRAREGAYIYLILLTSHDNTEHIIQGLGAGADDFIAKPFEPQVLRARLKTAQRLLGLQDQLAAKNRELAQANGELAHANLELERIATTDPLLKIGNRRSFEDMIVHTHSTARRTGHPYGVVIADIDHFKNFNDRYGHSFGDQVLRRVAQSMKDSLASAGTLFRYGGEELIAVLPDVRNHEIAAVAERLRVAVESTVIELPTSVLGGVTVSLGTAVFDPDDAISCQVVIDYADVSLYHAKRKGRNRVSSWPFEEATPPRTSQF